MGLDGMDAATPEAAGSAKGISVVISGGRGVPLNEKDRTASMRTWHEISGFVSVTIRSSGTEEGQSIGPGAPHQLGWVLGIDALRKHFFGAALVPGIGLASTAFHQGVDFTQSFHLHFLRQLVVPIGCRGVGPG